MLNNGFKWIDSDMHLAEPGDLWDQYIDPQYREVYRHWTRTGPDFNSLLQAPGEAPRPAVAGNAVLDAPVPSQPHVLGSEAIKERHYEDFLPYVSGGGAVI